MKSKKPLFNWNDVDFNHTSKCPKCNETSICKTPEGKTRYFSFCAGRVICFKPMTKEQFQQKQIEYQEIIKWNQENTEKPWYEKRPKLKKDSLRSKFNKKLHEQNKKTNSFKSIKDMQFFLCSNFGQRETWDNKKYKQACEYLTRRYGFDMREIEKLI